MFHCDGAGPTRNSGVTGKEDTLTLTHSAAIERGQIKVFTALQDIAPGEEITVNYNGEPEDDSSIVFEVAVASPIHPDHLGGLVDCRHSED
jgi:SET domain-containing protein